MAKLNKHDLLNVIVAGITEAGWNVLYLDENHPFRLRIYNAQAGFTTRIYIWNITHGGGKARPANEYRIQITGIDQFQSEPNGKTLILGWWDEANLFSGWDFQRHKSRLGASPSLQIRKECLDQAYISGFSPCLKDNQEIAIAFRPDFLIEYVANLESLHQFGDSPHDFSALEAVAVDPISVNQADLQDVATPRRLVLRSIQQRLRSASFRSRVLNAYNYRCAFCGIQLELVQAAHILPVTELQSTDDTYNGVSACYLHHAAYDRGYITFDSRYNVAVNENQMRRLIQKHREGEMSRFRNELRSLILLPPSVTDRPHHDLVREANNVRGWANLS